MRGTGRLLAVVALLVTSPAGALGQERERVIVEGRAGAAFPLGELADITDAGPSFGAGAAYFFHPVIGVGADLGVSLLSASAPDPFEVIQVTSIDLIHFGAALVLDFGPPSHQDIPLSFRASAGAGLTAMSAGSEVDFSETYFTVSGLGRIGYRIREGLELFVGTDVRVIVTDDQETAVFFQGPTEVDPMNLAISLPVTIGVTARVN